MLFYYRVRITILLSCILFLTTACLSEDMEQLKSIQKDSAEMNLSIQLPGINKPTTKSSGTFHEEDIETVDVFVFTDTGILVDFSHGVNITDISSNNDIIHTFSVRLKTGMNRDLMILTNAREIIENTFPTGIPINAITKENFSKQLTMRISTTEGWNSAPGSAGYRPIPMWGIKKNLTITGDDSLSDINNVKVTRMVARVNIALANTIIAENFRLASVRVYNYNTNGRIIPDEENEEWTNPTPYAIKPTLPTDPGLTEGPVEYLTMTTPDQALTHTIYLFEAEKGTAPSSNSIDDYMQNICLVIGGYYGGSSDESFYRIDFATTHNGVVTYLDILRNYSYNITIQGLSGPGKETPGEAFNSLPDNIEAGIVHWNDYEIDDIWFDGQYYYSVTPQLTRLNVEASTNNRITMTTDYPTWSYELSDLPTPGDPMANPNHVNWLTVTSHTAGQTYDNVLPDNHLLFDVTRNETGNLRKAYIHISVGRMIMTVKIEQSIWFLTNVYMTPTGNIHSGGETRTIAMEGLFDNTEVRAWDITRNELIEQNIIPTNIQTGTVSTAELTIPALWHPVDHTQSINRIISFEYFNEQENNWRLIRTEDQAGYYVHVSSDHVQGVNISNSGASYTVEAWGNFPTILLRAFDGTNNISGPQTTQITAGTVSQSSPISGIIEIPANEDTENARIIDLQYSIDEGISWHTLSSAQQPKAPLPLSTNRIVAEVDALSAGTTGDGGMSWATAMGISTSNPNYNSILFDSPNYNPTTITGCGGYYEDSPENEKTGIGKWKVPTREEMTEMRRSGIYELLSILYWTSEEEGAGRAYTCHQNGTIMYHGKLNNRYNVRCVREL